MLRSVPVRRLLVRVLFPVFGCLSAADAAELAPAIRRALSDHGTVVLCVDLADGSGAPVSARQPLELRSAQDRLVARLPEGAELRHRYRYSPAVALDVSSEEALERLAGLPDVRSIELDTGGRGALLESRALVGADDLFEFGVTGEGRIVAILDTGVDTDHPDLAGAVVHEYHIFGGADTGPGAEDNHGHGTHVAGIIASRGVESPRGIAPGCQIVAVKVLSENNRGFLTDWAAGVEHVVGPTTTGCGST